MTSAKLYTSDAALSVGILSASLSRKSGGIGPIMRNHAHQLIANGLDVKVFGVRDPELKADSEYWNGVVLDTHAALLRKAALAPSLGKAVYGANLDLLHLHGLWLYPSAVAAQWRQQTQKPLVISTQGMLEPWAVANSPLLKRVAARLFERNNLHEAACIHCSASEVAGVRDFGIKRPIAVIANGAELPDLSVRVPRPDVLGPGNRRTLLFLGRLHPKKGLNEAISAWSQLSAEREHLKNWQFVISGWDEEGEEQRLRSSIERYGLGDSVRLIGPSFGADKDALLRHSDAFILPSFSEGLPIAVLEAWSYALPTLITDACNLTDAFPAQAAIRVDNDPALLADQIGTALEADDLLDVGSRARGHVENHYSWKRIGLQLVALYQWLLDMGPLPSFILLD